MAFHLVLSQLLHMITFDEISDLSLYWSFLKVLDHHVGNSGQMTHVASSGAALSPEIHSHTLTFNTYTITPLHVFVFIKVTD